MICLDFRKKSENIVYGSTLSKDGFSLHLHFDFMLSNPPYGRDFGKMLQG
jgi:type I restriction-modification system DNA methylase subunit